MSLRRTWYFEFHIIPWLHLVLDKKLARALIQQDKMKSTWKDRQTPFQAGKARSETILLNDFVYLKINFTTNSI